jgi:DNA helicase II / ATP-dependent DNA helicase PcrA
MKFYADLHMHSHYSRATSKNLDLEHLALWAQLKGIHVIGTGDFVHPKWLAELQEKLEPAEDGLFKLKEQYAKTVCGQLPSACRSEVRFILTVEISNIYKKLGRVRKAHNLIWVPSFKAAQTISDKLGSIGNIHSDGRPILGLPCKDLLEISLEADDRTLFVPAHIWTPWFSVLGSKGGYDAVTDCFDDLTRYIYAVETGLSSDPIMNWRLKQLDQFILVSNSDAHSPPKVGRESNLFDTDFSYQGIYNALADPKDKGLVATIEFFPEEGKYHYDGHRMCQTRLHPKETIKNKGLCPACQKPVVVGVMARVEELADRKEGEKPPRWRPYKNLITLPEVISDAVCIGPNSKSVQTTFPRLLSKLGNELDILLDRPIDDIRRAAGDLIAEGVSRMRKGEVDIKPGYDGEYGQINILSSEDRKTSEEKQLTLFR